MQTIDNLIAGKPRRSGSSRTAPIFNPATGEQTGVLPLSTAAELDEAVAIAKEAQRAWGDTPPLKRARVMFRFKDILEQNADRIARAISAEHGKTHDDALGEVQRGLEVVEFAAGIPQLLKGEYSKNVGPAIDSYSDRQPLGVVAGITPFNFPCMVPLWMYPVAIAAGNAFILKPSERDPSAALLVAALMYEAGLPAGLLNVVHGDKEVVDAILHHPDIKAVSFVGSTPIAAYVYATGAANAKRVQALGGAKNHMIIMPDADLDKVADALMGAGYGSAGERCMAVSVAVPIGQKTADALVEALAPRVRALKIGPATDREAEMGPLVTRQHLDKVSGYIDKGVAEGARLLVDGRGFKLQGYENGYFLGGTLFDHVDKDMTIYREEIFGPVLCVLRAQSYQEALGLVNAHEFGNGTAIFTRDGDAARHFADKVEAGMVGINVPIPVPVPLFSFTGSRASKLGDLGPYGKQVILFYTQTKTITQRWFDDSTLHVGVNTTISLR